MPFTETLHLSEEDNCLGQVDTLYRFFLRDPCSCDYLNLQKFSLRTLPVEQLKGTSVLAEVERTCLLQFVNLGKLFVANI